jgi:transcriptional regulator with XRE-family HTH domain
MYYVERNSQSEKIPLSRSQLKYERERRGWTLEYVATQINCPDPHMLGRWERRANTPSPRYRQALCELFGKDAEELELITKESEGKDEPTIDWPQPRSDEKPSITRPQAHFFFSEKLPRSDELYGRSIERETLLNRTYNHASTSIVGPRRIGKTWLVEYLQLEAKVQLGSRFRIGYLNAMMASCSTVVGFIARASRELGVPLTPDRAELGLVALEDIVEKLKAKGLHPILCIDDFEGFSGRPGFDVNFFASLRAMAQIGLCLIAVSRQPLIDLVGNDGKTSGFFNIFEQLTLEPFDREDAEDFVTTKSKQVDFNAQEQAMMLHYGQLADELWSPIRLQLTGKMLQEDKTLHAKGAGQRYRPDDPSYWQKFERRLEEKYRGVVR